MKRDRISRPKRKISTLQIILIGVVLFLLVNALTFCMVIKAEISSERSAMNTLKQQCLTFNNLTSADQAKSLFRLSELMSVIQKDLNETSEPVTDAYLEERVNDTRVSGIAILDENLRLAVSGYTRPFRDEMWQNTSLGNRFSDIVTSPRKTYITRIRIGEEYYDLCALARTDAPGIILGFYKQPTGIISDTRNDLESLIGGMSLERDGQYVITQDGVVAVSSNESLRNLGANDSKLIAKLSELPKNATAKLFFAEGKCYFGYRSGCEEYVLYIYYPVGRILLSMLAASSIFLAIYVLLCFLYFNVRHRALYENQEKLREINRSLCEKHEKLMESNERLSNTVKMLRSLETIYFSLFYVNIVKDEYKTIYIAPWLQNEVPPSGMFSDLQKFFLGTMVADEFKEDLALHMTYAYIRDALSQANITDVRKSFYTDYQAILNGARRWCRVTVTAVDYDEKGNPVHVLTLLQDVDVEKTKEAEYQERILQESQDAKIANNAKTEFLRRISHDVRTPINGIKGYFEIGAQHPDDLAVQNYCREKATTSANVLFELINSLLDMSKLESGEIITEEKPFDLTKLLDDINTILRPQAIKRNIDYEVLRKGGVPFTHLVGSPRLVSRIIMNITSNAVKYSKPGGWIHVNTIMIEKNDTQVTYEFICADNGIGMSEEFQKHMFEPFTQEAISARTTYEGSGLGLSIVKKLVNALGGTIVCESKKDIGTTFRIRMTFLIDPEYTHTDTIPNQVNDSVSIPGGKNALLVEDNEINMEIAELLLTEAGINVVKAWNGREAVEAFSASSPGFYDMIFMDIMMPEMDGLEATRKIRALDRKDAKTVPICAMSANAFEDDIRKSRQAGMNEHLPKPIDAKKLVGMVNELLSDSQKAKNATDN